MSLWRDFWRPYLCGVGPPSAFMLLGHVAGALPGWWGRGLACLLCAGGVLYPWWWVRRFKRLLREEEMARDAEARLGGEGDLRLVAAGDTLPGGGHG